MNKTLQTVSAAAAITAAASGVGLVHADEVQASTDQTSNIVSQAQAETVTAEQVSQAKTVADNAATDAAIATSQAGIDYKAVETATENVNTAKSTLDNAQATAQNATPETIGRR